MVISSIISITCEAVRTIPIYVCMQMWPGRFSPKQSHSGIVAKNLSERAWISMEFPLILFVFFSASLGFYTRNGFIGGLNPENHPIDKPMVTFNGYSESYASCTLWPRG